MNNHEQLSLAVSLRDDATFDSFYTSSANRVVIKALRQHCSGDGDLNLLIWGGKGAGLSHLLQACTDSCLNNGFSAQYIPLAELINFPPEDVFDSLDSIDLVCIDDIDRICGHAQWEQGLFHFYNRLKDNSRRLLLASHISPAELDIQLPDLKSRICGSVPYNVQPLCDEDKLEALKLRASIRGMELSDEVANYILTRSSRENTVLFNALNVLDASSLREKRLLTIPFVKTVLAL